MRFAVVALICLAGCQCQRPPLVSADGELRADLLRVDFGDAWLNSTVTRPLMLSNTGRSSMTLALDAQPPFKAPRQLTLNGGESREVRLTFEPTALGAAAAALDVQAGNARLTLALEGKGIAAPPCDSSSCRAGRLDEATLSCIQSPLPNGTQCNDRCVTGSCSNGACVGTIDTCDDSDPCTVDACAPDEGCVHLPKSCASADPCSVGSCSADAGCVQTAALDGTSCGLADCTTAKVCITGQCVDRVVPDGSACGPQSICQARGVCTAQACVQPAATPLTRAWNYASPHRLYGLVADPQGNYFTAECRNAGMFKAQCELVSFSPKGVERWRTPFPHISATGYGALRDSLMIAQEMVISTIGPSWVDAFDVTTGGHKWSVDTSTSGIFGANNPTFVRFNATAFNGIDDVIACLESQSGGSIGTTRVVALSATSGALRHSLLLPAQGFSIVVDKNANIYLGHLSGFPAIADTVTALDPNWNLRWQRTNPVMDNKISLLRATHQGRLLYTHPTVSLLMSTSSGATFGTSSTVTSLTEPPAVWSDTRLFIAQQFCPIGVTCQSFSDFQLALVGMDGLAGNKVISSSFPPLSWSTSPWLTQRGTVLLSLRPQTLPAELREYGEDGVVKMTCPLGLAPNRSTLSDPVLTVGHYALISGSDSGGYDSQLDVWEVPGYAPGLAGWISRRGGPGLDSRAR